MKIRLGFVSNSSSSSFVITENKLDKVRDAANDSFAYTEIDPKDREAILRGIIARAQEDINGQWDVEENTKKIERAKDLLVIRPETKLYLTDLISDGYWTTDLFYEDNDVIEYATSTMYCDLPQYEGSISIYPEDCLSHEFNLENLNKKHRELLIDVYNSLSPDEVSKTVRTLDFTYLSQDSRKIICDLYKKYEEIEYNS